MEYEYEYTQKFNNDNIDCYVFLFSENFLKNKKKIENYLNITFPGSLTANFEGKSGEIKTFYSEKFSIILGGIGKVDKEGKVCGRNIDMTISKIGKKLNRSNYKEILVGSFNESQQKNLLNNQFESLINSMYKFDKYINSNNKKKVKIYLYSDNVKDKEDINESIYIGKLSNFTRNLSNEPANICNSDYLEKIIKDEFSKSNISIEILDNEKLKENNLNLILGVNKGSNNPAKMIILKNTNYDKKEKSKIFIGKGVTFDSGGLDIKIRNMNTMKMDMTGGGMIISLFKYVNDYNLKGNYIGIIPLVENMVDSNSIRPGDILESYSKKKVEVLNTDAEGRLILADGISYAIEKFDPEYIVDIATLTGSAFNIFNGLSIVMIGTDEKLKKSMMNAGKLKNERIWELPLWEDYVKLTKSDVADVKNVSPGVRAGTIMAAAFLKNFVGKIKWIHLDIAGVDFLKNESKTLHSGSTGIGLRTLIEFIKNNSNNL